MSRLALASLILLFGPGQLVAQLTLNDPNYTVTLLAGGLSASGPGMAVDAFGNVYINDVGGAITQITDAGVVNPNHATGFANLGQLVFNPADGFVYTVDFSPVLPVLQSTVWRLEPTGGRTQVASIGMTATGFAIRNDGRMFFGGSGIQGPGLYEYDPVTTALSFRDLGFGQNRILLALVDGDILIAPGQSAPGGQAEVRRWSAATGTVAYYGPGGVIIGNQFDNVTALARSPFNGLGKGAFLGLNSFVTIGFAGTGSGIFADELGANQTTLITESYASGPIVPISQSGVRTLASGLRQDLYWYSDVAPPGAPAPGGFLWKIVTMPAMSTAGSLFTGVFPGPSPTMPQQIVVDFYAPAGSPFLLGAVGVPFPLNFPLLLLPYGILDINPFSALYLPIRDGLGLFGPPDPTAVIPNSGAFQWTIPLPPGVIVPGLQLQALAVSTAAPNGLFYISNNAFLP